MKKLSLLSLVAGIILLVSFLISCGAKPSREATEEEMAAALEVPLVVLLQTLFSMPYDKLSEPTISFSLSEDLKGEINQGKSNITYKITGLWDGANELNAELKVSGFNLEEFNTSEFDTDMKLSGFFEWENKNKEKVKIEFKEIVIPAEGNPSGELWYTLPGSKEIVRITLESYGGSW